MALLIFHNDACMAVNKLPGESSEQCPGGKYPVPVHRLDTPVSGCLLLAKTREAAAFLGAAFARTAGTPGVRKRYWAVVEKPRAEISAQGELVHWLSFDSGKNKSFAHNEAGHGRKRAVLSYRTAGQGDRYLFLEIDLVTGRHHQIRAQLAACGLHIKGDLKYGAKRSDRAGIRLHSHFLSFPNPLSPAETISVTALPPLMDTLWTAFAREIEDRL